MATAYNYIEPDAKGTRDFIEYSSADFTVTDFHSADRVCVVMRLPEPTMPLHCKMIGCSVKFDGSCPVWRTVELTEQGKADPADQFIGKAYSQRFSTEDRFGDRFLEIAETVAKGRALADAGYGTQFCMNGEALASIIADAPIKMPPDEDAGHPGSVVASFTAQPTADPPVFSQTATAPKSTQPAQQQVQPPVQQSHAPAPEPPKTLDEYLRVMTIEQAKAVKVDFGRFSGWSLGEIAMKSPGDLAWYVKNYSGHNLALKAGATKLLETVGQMAS